MRRVRAVKLCMILVVYWYSTVSVASFSSCSCRSRNDAIRERPRGLFPPVSARSEKEPSRLWSRQSSWLCAFANKQQISVEQDGRTAPVLLQTTTKRKDDGRKKRDEAEESSTRTRSSNQLSHVLYVGNLDWSLTLQECESMLLTMLSADHSVLNNELFPTLKIKSTTNRSRDAGKRNGGSATLTFASPAAASAALSALSRHPVTHDRALRVRLAYKSSDSSAARGVAVPPSPERVLLRQERAASYARRRQRVAARTDAVIEKVVQALVAAPDDDDDVSDLQKSLAQLSLPVLQAKPLVWNAAPAAIDPARGGGLNAATRDSTAMQRRATRKRAAVEAFLVVAKALVMGKNGGDGDDVLCQSDHSKKKSHSTTAIADLGCGAGNLALPLAWWLQHDSTTHDSYSVLGVDLNGLALERLQDRAVKSAKGDASPPLITTLQQDLLELVVVPNGAERGENDDNVLGFSDCSAVVSLHACGAASDLAIAAALRRDLPFAVSPCCIGKVNSVRREAMEQRIATLGLPPAPKSSINRSAAPKETITYPRSKWLQDLITTEEYQLLTKSADFGSSESMDNDQELLRHQRSRKAKIIVEEDRLRWASERGYFVRMLELPRIGPFYAKRELLLGAMQGSPAARRIAELSVCVG